jgi:hypothetical protein
MIQKVGTGTDVTDLLMKGFEQLLPVPAADY